MNTLFQSIPTTEGVRKVGPGQGERFDIAGAHLTWRSKVRKVDMPFLFANKRLLRGRGSSPLPCFRRGILCTLRCGRFLSVSRRRGRLDSLRDGRSHDPSAELTSRVPKQIV